MFDQTGPAGAQDHGYAVLVDLGALPDVICGLLGGFIRISREHIFERYNEAIALKMSIFDNQPSRNRRYLLTMYGWY
jgi:hypothetical protein